MTRHLKGKEQSIFVTSDRRSNGTIRTIIFMNRPLVSIERGALQFVRHSASRHRKRDSSPRPDRLVGNRERHSLLRATPPTATRAASLRGDCSDNDARRRRNPILFRVIAPSSRAALSATRYRGGLPDFFSGDDAFTWSSIGAVDG